MAQAREDERSRRVKLLHDAALDAGDAAMARALERGFPVRLIGTFGHLVTCAVDERVDALLARADIEPFDQWPVVEDGRIVGLLRRCRLPAAVGPATRVRDVLDRLDETVLIAADAGILAFLLEAKAHSCRLILDGGRITGLVSRSDLQKLPVRSLLFHIVTHLELALAAWIRRHLPDEARWLRVLTPARRRAVEQRHAALAAARLAVDRLTATMFADKRAVLLRTAALRTSRKLAQAELEQIEALRDAVAHIGDYALTQEAADRTIDTVALARSWIGALRSIELDARAARLTAPR